MANIASSSNITAVQLTEGAAPSTPPTGKWKVYTKTTGLYVMDDTGAETGPLSAGGGTDVTLTDKAAPTNPSDGQTILYAQDTNGPGLLAMLHQYGDGFFLPPFGNYRWWSCNGAGNGEYGTYSAGGVGSLAYLAGSTTDALGRMPYRRMTTSAVANNSSAQYFNYAHDALFRQMSGYTFCGGFLHRVRFGYDKLTNTTMKLAYGVGSGSSSWALGSGQEPSGLTDIVIVGCDAADTNLQFMHNDSAGTATKIDTGLAKATANGKVLDFFVLVANNGNIKVGLHYPAGGVFYGANITTDLPTAATALYPKQQIANGADAIACYGYIHRMDTIVFDYQL